MDEFKWRFRFVNPAILLSCFVPGTWRRRDIKLLAANDNEAFA